MPRRTFERDARRMMQRYRGRITLVEGDEVDVDLELTDETVRLATDAAEIGTWAREECEIVATGDGAYEIVVDGDRVSFVPFDGEPFAEGLTSSNGTGGSDHLRPIGSENGSWGDHHADTADDGEETAEDEAAPRGDGPVADVYTDESVHIDGDVDADGEPDVDLVAATEPTEIAESEIAEPTEIAELEIAEPEIAGPVEVAEPEVADPEITEPTEITAPEVAGPSVAIAASVSSPTDETGPLEAADRWDESDGPLDAVDRHHHIAATDDDPEVGPEDDDVDFEALESALAEIDVSESGEPVADDVDEPSESRLGSWFRSAIGGSDTRSPDESSEPDESPDDEPDEEDAKGRFGGSSVERLAAAVGSLKKQQAMTPADEAVATAQAEWEAPDSVADGVLASQRTLRETKVVQRLTWDLVRKVAAGILLGVGIAALIVLAPRAIEVLTRDAEPVVTVPPDGVGTTLPDVTSTTTPGGSVPTTTLPNTATTVPSSTTTSAPTTTVPSGPTIFDASASDFVSRWNEVAGSIASVLTFQALPPSGVFENEFYPYLSMTGTIGVDGTVDEFALVVDPQGPADADRVAIQALGAAIAVVDEDSTGSSRSALLAGLGLDVRNPQLVGIDSTVDSKGIRYTLKYDDDAVTLTFTIAPVPSG